MADRTTLIKKGEGGANVVVQYKNSKNLSQVIRLRKSCLNKEKLPEPGIDELIWPELLEQQGTRLLPLQSDLKYIKEILAPLIGSQYIPPQEFINLDKDESQIYGATQGVVMPDVTLLPLLLPPPLPATTSRQLQYPPPTICIEIKPKYGSITQCSTVHPEDVSLKRSTSRYQLHQLLKKHHKTIYTVSSYDPLDLFSGDPDRMEKALCSLLKNPQNNLNLFINGQPVDLTTGDGGRAASKFLSTAAEMLLGGAENPLDAQSNKNFLVNVLRQILQQEPVLQNIRRAQQACRVDIVGINLLYNAMLKKITKMEASRDSHEEKEITEEEDNKSEDYQVQIAAEEERKHQRDALHALLQMPWNEAVAALRSYIIATTAKDCSIMITMMSRNSTSTDGTAADESAKHQTENKNGVAIVSFEKQEQKGQIVRRRVEYRISVVDLDRKSTLKIPKHYELDQEIMKAAKTRRQAVEI